MAQLDEAPELELRDYLKVLRRRKWLIAATVVVITGGAVAWAELQTARYTATADVLIQPSNTVALFSQVGVQPLNATDIATQIQVVRSQPVRQAAQAKSGPNTQASVKQVGQTDVVAISATNTDPRQAAAIANAYANAYIDFRRTQNVDDQLAAATQIQARIADLQNQIDALNAQATTAEAKGASTPNPQVQSLIQEQGVFKQQLGQLQVEASLNNGGAQLVTPATAPTSPSSPKPKRDGAIALAVGLLVGVALAFLREYLDDSIKSKEELDRVSRVPTLAMVPSVGSWRSDKEALLISVEDPKAPAAEAYRSLRTSIQFAALERPMKTLQMTSPSASEGKTTTIANLAVVLASGGHQVIVTCCDLRRPRLHEFFGLDNSVGFTSVLLGEVPLAEAIQAVPGVEGLYLLASGPQPPNPAELLSSPRAAEVLAAMQARADHVLIDCPPVLPVTDAAVMSTRVDATLMVVTAGITTRKELTRALELLAHVDAPVLGTVLNGVGGDGTYGYGYRYYRYHKTYEADTHDGTNGRHRLRLPARS